jgi:hypothetical protein
MSVAQQPDEVLLMTDPNAPDPKITQKPQADRPVPDAPSHDSDATAPSRPTPDPTPTTAGRQRSHTSGDGKTDGREDQDPDSAFADVDRDDTVDVP